MGAYNPNKGLIEDANKAAACGMSYGKWREEGCPEPPKDAKTKDGYKRRGLVEFNTRRIKRK